jgi:hypothetical protein
VLPFFQAPESTMNAVACLAKQWIHRQILNTIQNAHKILQGFFFSPEKVRVPGNLFQIALRKL